MSKNALACVSWEEHCSVRYIKCDCSMFLVCHTKHIVIVAGIDYPLLTWTDFGLDYACWISD